MFDGRKLVLPLLLRLGAGVSLFEGVKSGVLWRGRHLGLARIPLHRGLKRELSRL
jgi:hypothetical protein